MSDPILNYIIELRSSIPNSVYRYLHGDCYKLARTLVNIFGGEVYMNNQRDHAIAKIRGKYYDINGSISLKHSDQYHIADNIEHKMASSWSYD